MNSTVRFFRKYFLSTIGIVILFVVVNIALMLGVLVMAFNNSTDPEIPLQSLSDSITVENNIVRSTSKSETILKSKEAWAMILNDNGIVIWESYLPPNLPHKYTATEIAKFSRWYLQGYPVVVQEHPAGLLVVGYPPNSIVRYSYILDINYISTIFMGFAIMFITNISLMLLLFWRNTHKIQKAVTPILGGIDIMAVGQSVSLPEKGELAEINSKLNRAGRQLLQKDQARAEWINGISHDVRTPLSIMLGYAGQIEDDNTLPDGVRIQGGIIRKQGEKLRRLISNLNLASKLEYSMQPLNITNICLVELARQVVSDFINNGLDECFDFDFQADADSEKIIVKGDSALMVRLLENLIQNSIKHNTDGCHISIRIIDRINSNLLVVMDTGSGLTESQLKQLNTSKGVTANNDWGNEATHGFGLRLVWQIVKAHNGTVQFENVQPQGLNVKIEFPIANRI